MTIGSLSHIGNRPKRKDGSGEKSALVAFPCPKDHFLLGILKDRLLAEFCCVLLWPRVSRVRRVWQSESACGSCV